MQARQSTTSNDNKNPQANGTTGAANQSDGAGSASARYEVSGRAGEGTLWVTYRVRDRNSDLTFALKALKTSFARHPRLTAALQTHLQQLATLRTKGLTQEHLAAVYEAGDEQKTPYFVTDWLPKGTLEDRLQRAPLGRSEALSVVRALAQALEALHAQNIAHGDVRPQQVRTMGDGSVKLTDCGQAQAFHDSGLQLTDIIGASAAYQAPERWDNRAPSVGADLYALGVILYRMLAARVPFDGTSPLAIAMRHRRDTPLKPSQFNANCPRDLERIAMRLLEKDPQSRYVSAAHLLRDLSPANDDDNSGDPVATLVTSAPLAAPIVATASNATAVPNVAPVFPAPQPSFAPVVDDEPTGTDVFDDADEEYTVRTARKKHRRREFWGALGALVWMIIAAASLGGLFVGAYKLWIQDLPDEVKVANYKGKNQSSAEAMLKKQGLTFRVAREVFDPKKPSGTVLSGEPPPGKTVRVGREIAATVSRGPEPIRMYDFTQLSLQQARQVAMRDGLRLGQVAEQYHDKIPAGYICAQFPEPGDNFKRSDPINLVVSRGPQPSETPIEPSALPPLPQPTYDASTDPQTPSINGIEQPSESTLVSRAVQIRVVIPTGSLQADVRVVANDVDGERTVYRETHKPGDVINETVQVTRQQGTTATVSVYVDNKLIREERV